VQLDSSISLPSRVRGILDRVRSVVDERLVAAIDRVLDETEQQLFRNAEHARSNAEQQSWFDALRELRRGRADVAPRLLVALEGALVRRPLPAEAVAPPRATGPRGGFDLVDPDELEIRLILEDGAARAEIRHHELLFALGHRFAVLWAAPPLSPAQLPVGPAGLNEAFAAAIAELRLQPAAMQTLLRIYERVVLQSLGALLEAVNAILVDAGVLRHFSGYEGRRREAEVAASADDPTAPVANRAPAAPGDASRPQRSPIAGATPAAARPAWTPEDQQRFDALRESLGRLRAMRSGAGAEAEPASVRPEDLQTVLSHLQAIPNPAQIVGGRRVPQSVAHIRQAMVEQLAQTLPPGTTPVLRADDEDVLDLMEVFLGTLQQDLKPDPATEQVMSRLQVPLVRLALVDRTFFTRPEHPARQLLNAIADASASWLEDDPEGRRMLERLGAIGDRLTNEFQHGVSLFEELLGDLTAHLQQSQRRAEAAERRHVEAAKGRERLALARRTVDAAIASRLAAAAPDDLLRTTLEQAWADVLALTLLRHGPDGEPYRRRLAVVDELLAARRIGSIGATQARALREELESGLALVGYPLGDIRQIMERLLGGIDGAADPDEALALAMKLRARARLGESRVIDPAGGDWGRPAGPEEQPWVDRIRELPIGTWFAPGSGDGPRLKLAWRSEALDLVLLVNRRATSAEERGVAQLARDLARGGLRIVLASPAPPVERVFQRILARAKASGEGAFHA
jgi:hypothetical protein